MPFSRNFERNMENIWNFNSFLINQKPFKNVHNTMQISNRSLFVRKHEKFFQISNISITKQFQIKSKIQTHHGEHIKPVWWSPLKNLSIALYEKYNFYKISKILKIEIYRRNNIDMEKKYDEFQMVWGYLLSCIFLYQKKKKKKMGK